MKKETLDPLTQLLDGSLFEGVLARELNRSRRYDSPISLLILEAQICEEAYEEMKNAVLKEMAKMIKNKSRTVDIAFRKDEQLIIIFPETFIDGALRAAVKFKEKAESHAYPGSKKYANFWIKIKGGLACFPGCGDTAEALTASALKNMEVPWEEKSFG